VCFFFRPALPLKKSLLTTPGSKNTNKTLDTCDDSTTCDSTMNTCDHCNLEFFTAIALRRHKRFVANIRPFVCEICQKAFKVRQHLDQHIRIHTGERPFECVKCGARFSNSGAYSQHKNSLVKRCIMKQQQSERSKHTGSVELFFRRKSRKSVKNIFACQNSEESLLEESSETGDATAEHYLECLLADITDQINADQICE
jgi:uncharacterized Zn-finger protein